MAFVFVFIDRASTYVFVLHVLLIFCDNLLCS
jgi:hypothetical protein